MVKAANRATKRIPHQVVPHAHPSRDDQPDRILTLLENAPVDDEPVTEDDRLQIAEGWEAYRTGRLVLGEEATHACLEADEGANGTVEGQTNRA